MSSKLEYKTTAQSYLINRIAQSNNLMEFRRVTNEALTANYSNKTNSTSKTRSSSIKNWINQTSQDAEGSDKTAYILVFIFIFFIVLFSIVSRVIYSFNDTTSHFVYLKYHRGMETTTVYGSSQRSSSVRKESKNIPTGSKT